MHKIQRVAERLKHCLFSLAILAASFGLYEIRRAVGTKKKPGSPDAAVNKAILSRGVMATRSSGIVCIRLTSSR